MVFQREVIRLDRKIAIQAIAGTPLPSWLFNVLRRQIIFCAGGVSAQFAPFACGRSESQWAEIQIKKKSRRNPANL